MNLKAKFPFLEVKKIFASLNTLSIYAPHSNELPPGTHSIGTGNERKALLDLVSYQDCRLHYWIIA